MDPITPTESEVSADFPPFFKVYKDGRVVRYITTAFVEPGHDPVTGLQSRDVTVSPESGVKARIFLPEIQNPDQNSKKLPLLVHYHGGGFSLESPFSPAARTLLSALSTQSKAMVFSTDFRLAPEHLLPTAYDDSLAALRWVALHAGGEGPDPWINEYADLNRVVVIGESAGATIAQYVAVQAGARELSGVKIEKLILIDPFFGNKDPIEYYKYICPTSSGTDDDPILNPAVDPDVLKLKCGKILVCVAEKDTFRDRGVMYYEFMKKSGWEGRVELYETKDEGHVFYIFNPKSENLQPFLKKIADFIKDEPKFLICSAMDSSTLQQSDEIAYDYSPFLIIYKDGRIKRLQGTEIVPPSLDSKTQVKSKDVIFSPEESNLSSRLFLPAKTSPDQKLPILIYFHGGAFCVQTPYSPPFHQSLNIIASEANVIAVSVDYRRTPEHPLPTAYEDSWTALKWVASHADGDGDEEWLNTHGDFGRVVLAGDSAGANIAHQVGLRFGEEAIDGISSVDGVLIHPYFWGKDPIGKEPRGGEVRIKMEAFWLFNCPASSGCDDLWINPATDPNLGKMGCGRMLVFVAGQDLFRDRGWYYYEKLKESGWGGTVEIMESEGEDHVFHLNNPETANAVDLYKRIASFINNGG